MVHVACKAGRLAPCPTNVMRVVDHQPAAPLVEKLRLSAKSGKSCAAVGSNRHPRIEAFSDREVPSCPSGATVDGQKCGALDPAHAQGVLVRRSGVKHNRGTKQMSWIGGID